MNSSTTSPQNSKTSSSSSNNNSSNNNSNDRSHHHESDEIRALLAERASHIVATSTRHHHHRASITTSSASAIMHPQQQEEQEEATNNEHDDDEILRIKNPAHVQQQENKSCWEFESLTPMTTRPHFTLVFDHHHHHHDDLDYRSSSLSPHHHYENRYHQGRARRSKSVGAEWEVAPDNNNMEKLLLLPPAYCPSLLSSSSGRDEDDAHKKGKMIPSLSSSAAAGLELPFQQQQQQDEYRNEQQQQQLLLLPSAAAHPQTILPLIDHDDDDDDDSPLKKKRAPSAMTTTTTAAATAEDELSKVAAAAATATSATTPAVHLHLIMNILYGMINATIVLPVVMSFSSIIYRHDAFRPYMPVLTKLTILSSMIHQICFCTFSSLPFAVGSVQDAGLIFLSGMTTYIVEYCHQYNYSDEIMLATVTVCISLCTAMLGLGLILLGRWKLAQYVQMLPTCVVGGYLAFIGWFCGIAGLRLMGASPGRNSSSDDSTTTTTNQQAQGQHEEETVFQLITQQWLFILPGVLGGIITYAAIRKLQHMAVLPTCILCMLLFFYVVLWWTDSSIEQVTQQGWIRAAEPAPVWYRTWDYLQLDKVVWSVLPNLLLTELGMIFVVALSSSLDVAAIELELKRPLNYNQELTTVGISNFISGLTGGYTGSYIFSQTIFSLRAGIRSRVSGYTLAACQLIVLLLPFPLLSYVPNFFFGSLLVLICVDLLYEWLWDVRTRVTMVEYFIDLATFLLIQWLGVEYGILSGVGLYLVCSRLGLDVGEDKFDADHEDEEPSSSSLFDEQNGSIEAFGGQTTEKPRQLPNYGATRL